MTVSTTFLANVVGNGSLSTAGQYCYSIAINTPSAGNVTLSFYEDATKSGSAQGRLAFSVQMSNTEAAAMGGHLSSPSNGTGP